MNLTLFLVPWYNQVRKKDVQINFSKNHVIFILHVLFVVLFMTPEPFESRLVEER